MVVVFALGYRPPRHPTLPGELGRGGYNYTGKYNIYSMSHLTLRFCLRDAFNDQNPRYKSAIYHCYIGNFDACVKNVCKAIFLAPGASAALASIISMLHHKNSTHFIRKHNMRAARVKTSHSSTLLTPYYAVLRLNMPIRPVHHDERYNMEVSQQTSAQNHDRTVEYDQHAAC